MEFSPEKSKINYLALRQSSRRVYRGYKKEWKRIGTKRRILWVKEKNKKKLRKAERTSYARMLTWIYIIYKVSTSHMSLFESISLRFNFSCAASKISGLLNGFLIPNSILLFNLHTTDLIHCLWKLVTLLFAPSFTRTRFWGQRKYQEGMILTLIVSL